MATSGTATFNLDIMDVIQESFEQAGLRLKTGYDIKTARRSLDLMSLEWQNRGINFWTVESISVALSASSASLTLPADTIDVIEMVIRTGTGTDQVDLPMTRISVSEYSSIPNKNTTGRPVNFWVDKQRDAPVVYLWPVPDSGSYTLVYYKLRRIEDTGANPAATDPDVPARFLPAFTAGLALRLSGKYAEAAHRKPELKVEFEEQWLLAVAGDRDRASVRFIPGGYRNL
tara:strand:- start:3387 stop:4076 length:690 start_codon:yes stop_codon:yes gene_type:complete